MRLLVASKEEREFEIMSYSLLKQYFDTNEFIIIPRGCFHNLNQLPKGIFPHFFVNLNDTIISYMQQRKGWYSEPDYVIIKRDSIDKWMIIKTIRNQEPSKTCINNPNDFQPICDEIVERRRMNQKGNRTIYLSSLENKEKFENELKDKISESIK